MEFLFDKRLLRMFLFMLFIIEYLIVEDNF